MVTFLKIMNSNLPAVDNKNNKKKETGKLPTKIIYLEQGSNSILN